MVKENQCKKVSDSIERWKKSLLDLSKRNKLLFISENYASKMLRIDLPYFKELINRLVEKGESLTFDYYSLVKEEFESESTDSRKKYIFKEGDLGTNQTEEELSSTLYRLRRELITWQEEQGIHTLFLASGFLKWRESPNSNETFEAPVILIPVKIDRESRYQPYFLKYVEEEIVVNPALIFKLQNDYGINLPDPPDEWSGETIELYLKDVEESVKETNWSVSRIVRIGKFSYKKFVMYNDLSEHITDACENLLIRSLSKISTIPMDKPPNIPDNLDEVLDPNEVFPILDADSSQTEVLLRVRAGQNLVIQGPPGTGKSQTISNIIAQGLRDGKRILFVSEKIAALEVVNRRLQQSGLSFACLEIHSHKSDKLKIIQELNRTLNESEKINNTESAKHEFEKLIQLRDNLNLYVKELHRPRGELGYSVYKVHGFYSRLIDAPFLEVQFPWTPILKVSHKELDNLITTLRKLQTFSKFIDSMDSYPWNGVIFASEHLTNLTFSDILMNIIATLGKDIEELRTRIRGIEEKFGVSFPKSIRELDKTVESINKIPERIVIPVNLAGQSHDYMLEFSDKLNIWIEHFKDLEKQREALSKVFKKEIISTDVEHYKEVFTNNYATPLRFLKSSYRYDMRVLKSYSKDSKKLDYKTCVEGLEYATKTKSQEHWKDSEDKIISSYLGNLYKGTDTDLKSIFDTIAWLNKIIGSLEKRQLGIGFWRMVEKLSDFKKYLEDEVNSSYILLKGIIQKITEITNFTTEFSIFGKKLEDTSVDDLYKWTSSKYKVSDFQQWREINLVLDECNKAGLANFLKSIQKYKIPAEDIETVFMKQFWKHWLAEVYSKVPILSNFSSTSHDNILLEFKKLDSKLKKNAIEIVKQRVLQSKPILGTEDLQSQTQKGILLKEAQKQRRLMPIRKLFSKAPHLIQALKPCMLMSPLSVAEYLGTSPFKFDLVIFDEASQIVPADAIGSILRGSQLVVAGDEKQLPPTRFFEADLTDDDDDEDSDEQLESILGECLALPDFHRSTLNWHYRSKREELIDFSNKEFYEGKLVTFPSTDSKDASRAIKFDYLENAVYDRGKTRTNLMEAKKVCDLLEKHYNSEERRKKSIGVITLNLAQEQAINNEWEKKLDENPSLSGISEINEVEPLFIKALEKVQGDERDFIILSIGYGKGPDGNISLNFGPLNKVGGERRLNVAITRAREEITVVSSILPEDLDLSRLTTKKRGIEVLQYYLDYAKNQTKQLETQGIGIPESEFELSVKEKLESCGFMVDSQVGCSGFRIDLAIKHPRNPSRYILGIECDGATYHSHRSARDRDRLRQEVLERLGWRIFRIWSTDWIKDPSRIIEAVTTRVEELASYKNNNNEIDNGSLQSSNSDSYNGRAAKTRDYKFRSNLVQYIGKVQTSASKSVQIRRSISELSSEEIRQAINMQVEKSYGITNKGLIKALSRQFGYQKSGKTITHRIQHEIDLLLKRGDIKMYNDQIVKNQRLVK